MRATQGLEWAVVGVFAGAGRTARVNDIRSVRPGDERLPAGDKPEHRKESD